MRSISMYFVDKEACHTADKLFVVAEDSYWAGHILENFHYLP